MKIKKGYVVREIAGQSFVIALGSESKSLNGMIKLNELARLIWDQLADGKGKKEIIEKILAEYRVERERAEADYDKLISTLQEVGVFEPD